MKKLASVLMSVSLAAVCSIGHASSNPDPETLKAALLSSENASTVIKNNKPLGIYLEKELGKKIELVVTTDYSSMTEAMRHGRIDIACFGPLSYVLAKQRSDIEPFAAMKQKGSTTYQSVLVANTGAGIAKISDIVNRNVAYGDKASTSSHLIPKSILVENGLKAGENYRERFVGAYDAVAMVVQNGHAQAGGLSKPIFESLVQRGLVDPNKIKVLAESKSHPQYPWTMCSNLKPELKEKIRAAFLNFKDPEVLKPFKADGFGPISDKDYDVVRSLGTLLKLDLSRF